MSQQQATHGILNWPSDDMSCLRPPRDSQGSRDEKWQMLPMMWGHGPCSPSVPVQPNCHKWDGCLFCTNGRLVTFSPYRLLMSCWWDACFSVSPYYLNGRQCVWWHVCHLTCRLYVYIKTHIRFLLVTWCLLALFLPTAIFRSVHKVPSYPLSP